MQLRDIHSGERMTDIQCEPGTQIYPSRDGEYVCLVREMEVSTYRVDNGQLQSQLRLDHGPIIEISVSNTRAAFLFKEEKGKGKVNELQFMWKHCFGLRNIQRSFAYVYVWLNL